MKAYSVAIIGAGISGLTLALELQKMPNLNINIFEKTNINGGRILSNPVSNDTYADLGANYFDF
jgi:predicted NAD/FAD-dependent oxidoreductase